MVDGRLSICVMNDEKRRAAGGGIGGVVEDNLLIYFKRQVNFSIARRGSQQNVLLFTLHLSSRRLYFWHPELAQQWGNPPREPLSTLSNKSNQQWST